MRRIKTKKQLVLCIDGKDPITVYYDNIVSWKYDIIVSLQIHEKIKIGCEITIFGDHVLKYEVEEICKGDNQSITINKLINILSVYLNHRYDYCLDINNDTKIICKSNDDNEELITLFDTSTKKELSFDQRPLNFYLRDQVCNKLMEDCDIISDVLSDDNMSSNDRYNLTYCIRKDIYSDKPLKQILDEYDILYYNIDLSDREEK